MTQIDAMFIISYCYYAVFLALAWFIAAEKAVAKTLGLLEMIMRKMIPFKWNRDSKFVSQIALWLHQRIFYDCNISTRSEGRFSAWTTVDNTTNLAA